MEGLYKRLVGPDHKLHLLASHPLHDVWDARYLYMGRQEPAHPLVPGLVYKLHVVPGLCHNAVSDADDDPWTSRKRSLVMLTDAGLA